VGDAEQQRRRGHGDDEAGGAVTEELAHAGLQVAAVGELLADGGQRPAEQEQPHQLAHVAAKVVERAEVLAAAGEVVRHRHEQPELDQ
jgi:hypothetical protein